MTTLGRREIANGILLVIGLTLLRLPRAFELENNPWILIITLIPYWFVIVNNHFPEIKAPSGFWGILIKICFQLFILFNIAGLLTLISAVFVKAFIDHASEAYLILAIGIIACCVIACLKSISVIMKRLDFDRTTAVLGVIYYLLIIIAIFRTSIQSPYLLLFIYQLITLLIFGLSSMYVLKDKEGKYLEYVFYGLLLYFSVNVIFQLSGITNQDANYLKSYEAVMLSLVGVESSRIYFPLAEGINAFGMVGGAGFVWSISKLYGLIKRKSSAGLTWLIPSLGVGISLLIILLTDSRGALLFGVFAIGLLIVLPRIKPIFSSLLLLIQPAVLLLTGNILNGIGFLSMLTRSNTDVLSGRSVIWATALRSLKTFNWVHLVGYGLFGQTISGIVVEYQDLFKSYINIDVISLHHFGLQSIYDLGYLGLIVAFGLFATMCINFRRKIRMQSKDCEAEQAYSLLIYFMGIGAVSAIPSFYARELFFIFIFIWISAGIRIQRRYVN